MFFFNRNYKIFLPIFFALLISPNVAWANDFNGLALVPFFLFAEFVCLPCGLIALLILIFAIFKDRKKDKKEIEILTPVFNRLGPNYVKKIEEEIKDKPKEVNSIAGDPVLAAKIELLENIKSCMQFDDCHSDVYRKTFIFLANERIKFLQKEIASKEAMINDEGSQHELNNGLLKNELAELDKNVAIAKHSYSYKSLIQITIILVILILIIIIICYHYFY